MARWKGRTALGRDSPEEGFTYRWVSGEFDPLARNSPQSNGSYPATDGTRSG